jgi:hypothetical protein
MAAQPARLLATFSVRRREAARRGMLAAAGALASAGAAAALHEAARRGLAHPLLLDGGVLLAVLLLGVLAVRAGQRAIYCFTHPPSEIRIYDQGLVWQVGRRSHRFRWKQLVRYREGARTLSLAGRTLLTWGAHTFTFASDDSRALVELRFSAAQGDPRAFAAAARPFAASITGMRISAALRRDQPVRLHRDLVVYPGGVEAGKAEIYWADLALEQARGWVIVRRLGPDGRAQDVGRYALHTLESPGGLFDIASSMRSITTAAPRRQTAGPPAAFRPGA